MKFRFNQSTTYLTPDEMPSINGVPIENPHTYYIISKILMYINEHITIKHEVSDLFIHDLNRAITKWTESVPYTAYYYTRFIEDIINNLAKAKNFSDIEFIDYNNRELFKRVNRNIKNNSYVIDSYISQDFHAGICGISFTKQELYNAVDNIRKAIKTKFKDINIDYHEFIKDISNVVDNFYSIYAYDSIKEYLKSDMNTQIISYNVIATMLIKVINNADDDFNKLVLKIQGFSEDIFDEINEKIKTGYYNNNVDFELSDEEIIIIDKLNIKPYSKEYIEEWLNKKESDKSYDEDKLQSVKNFYNQVVKPLIKLNN